MFGNTSRIFNFFHDNHDFCVNKNDIKKIIENRSDTEFIENLQKSTTRSWNLQSFFTFRSKDKTVEVRKDLKKKKKNIEKKK